MDAVRLDVNVLDIWELVPNERLEPAHHVLIRPLAIRGHPRPIRGHQRPSKAITPVNLGAQEDAVELVDREEEGLCLDGWLG